MLVENTGLTRACSFSRGWPDNNVEVLTIGTPHMRILLVSQPHAEAAWLHKAFQESAHSLQRADDHRDGIFLATHEPFDAIVALATEPGAHTSLMGALPSFAALPNGPIVIAIVRSVGTQDRIHMLRMGADACFSHPWSFIEIHERIMALHRTGGPRGVAAGAPASAPQGSLGLDAATRELVDGDERLALTKREYQLLECLLRQANTPVPREQLIRYAWSEKDDVDPASVNLVVSRLRRKLAKLFPHVHIETVSRFGYQLSVVG
jgi:two-component system, OmpR family, response regulator